MHRRGLRSPGLQVANRKSPVRQRGYMMITLMLIVALMTFAMLAAIPSIKQQILRDREDEMRHRGTAYMRAIQHYYKKFNAYPNKVEDLENTNNLRFLRKRYTDPMTRDPITGKEKDFKFLHQQDISLNNGPVLGGQAPGQGGPNSPGGFGAQGGFGGQGGFGSQGGLGGPQGQSAFGGNQGGFGGPTANAGPAAQNSANADSDNSSGGSPSGPGGNSNSFGPSSPGSSPNSASGSGFNGPVFGGGPILGVASTNKKDKSIREFYGKNHYNDWLFIYMPMADRGGLLVGPVNPSMPTGNMGGLTPGQMAAGQNGLGQNGVGQGGFGQSGFGQGSMSPGGFGQGFGQNGGQNQGIQPQTPQPSPQQ
jgi:type II secretory pathway pseudopilin PulG